jgi:(E)-4-hydroxy-3-methylbut-2-enyl-diphosphate synthase
MKYSEATQKSKRMKTREVMVGSVGVGGSNPVRIQSMTTSSTSDIEATVEQIIRLADAGCEIARVTVQGMKEAKACEGIKNTLLKKGYNIPLVADIHFFPAAAMTVIDFVDKVRINPGNYVDKRANFKTLEYDDDSYGKELERLEEKFSPLVLKCKKLNKAMRIGTNHGSLSDRIMNRYGDSPIGMLESAVEFTNVCRKYDFHDIIFSMKASNTQVMIEAYRRLSSKMYELGWDYPLHLGVTEAGEGEDGRIKSAVGIGSLLLDGIGDTIRVSLTEDPWFEIDPCQRLVALSKDYQKKPGVKEFEEKHRGIEREKRSVSLERKPYVHKDGGVFLRVKEEDILDPDFELKVGITKKLGEKVKELNACDVIYFEGEKPSFEALEKLTELHHLGIFVLSSFLFSNFIYLRAPIEEDLLPTNFSSPLELLSKERPSLALSVDASKEDLEKVCLLKPDCFVFFAKGNNLYLARRFFELLQRAKNLTPVILAFDYQGMDRDDLLIASAAEKGSLFCDGLGDGLLVLSDYGLIFNRKLSFNILQASRKRTVKTEFISCPSCGRTLFDLQTVSRRIREKTQHLPGVKIAIMGCIVNGPGEMADADFGYVGSRPGKVDLYVNKKCVEKNIDHDAADAKLIDLIKEHGRWIEMTPEQELESKETLLTS